MELFANNPELTSWALLALRLAIAVSFIVHGSQKLAMWKMQPSEQMPAKMLSMMRLLSIVEPLGGIALLFGFLTQPAALGIAIIMIGAINLKVSQMHKKFSEPGGWELDLVLLLGSLALFFVGAGKISIDHIIF